MVHSQSYSQEIAQELKGNSISLILTIFQTLKLDMNFTALFLKLCFSIGLILSNSLDYSEWLSSKVPEKNIPLRSSLGNWVVSLSFCPLSCSSLPPTMQNLVRDVKLCFCMREKKKTKNTFT